jgi:hypothetical protein
MEGIKMTGREMKEITPEVSANLGTMIDVHNEITVRLSDLPALDRKKCKRGAYVTFIMGDEEGFTATYQHHDGECYDIRIHRREKNTK